MEIKVSATGKSSRLPERFIANLYIHASSKVVDSAKDLQQAKLRRVTTVLSKHGVSFRYLSSPNVYELTQREDEVDTESNKTTYKWVVCGYSYYQDAEVSVDGWSMDSINALMKDLSSVCDNINTRFDLTEAQQEAMYKEALERSYQIAVSSATTMCCLESNRSGNQFSVPQIRLKEASIVAQDHEESFEGCSKVAKSSSLMSEEKVSKPVLPVKKPMEVLNTVNYIFEG